MNDNMCVSTMPAMPEVVIIPMKDVYVVRPFSDAAKETFVPTEENGTTCYRKEWGAYNSIVAACMLLGIPYRFDESISQKEPS